MKRIFLIEEGFTTQGVHEDVWNGFVRGYFEYKDDAQLYLTNQGYERDFDEVFFLQDEQSDNEKIARIIAIEKL